MVSLAERLPKIHGRPFTMTNTTWHITFDSPKGSLTLSFAFAGVESTQEQTATANVRLTVPLFTVDQTTWITRQELAELGECLKDLIQGRRRHMRWETSDGDVSIQIHSCASGFCVKAQLEAVADLAECATQLLGLDIDSEMLEAGASAAADALLAFERC